VKKNEISIDDYPLRQKRSDLLFTHNGVNINDITFENIYAGVLSRDECRISKDSLILQAKIADDIGNTHLAGNFRRAAEMIEIESDRIIEIYNALRPYRSTEGELRKVVKELKEKYNATITATFIEEAIIIMKERKRLKGDR